MLFKSTASFQSPAWHFGILTLLLNGASANPIPSTSIPVYQPRPYTISVDNNLIEQARIKARDFRNSIDVPAPSWFDGPPAKEIASIAEYWANEYDWNATQANLNSDFTHYYTTVPPPSVNYTQPVDIHFVHQRSARADAIPILFLHGWPSTHREWLEIIPGLVDPVNATDPAFHVVAPDFPGSAFSPPLSGSRVNVSRADYATIFADLMSQLGYSRYILYSTDLGAIVAMDFVVTYRERIINHISDFYLTLPSDEDQARFDANLTTPEENFYIRGSNAFFNQHSGYSALQKTYPLTLAYSLTDSPIGFLAYYYHLAQSVTDKQISMHEIVTNTLTLWIPGVYASIKTYKELFGSLQFTPPEKYTVPTSVLQFGGVSHYPELDGWQIVVSQAYTFKIYFH
jgi:pimeloyl-ACP methyl ester carboxylesterase